jgi:hypothetical protein
MTEEEASVVLHAYTFTLPRFFAAAAYSRFDCQRLSLVTETSSNPPATRLRRRRRRRRRQWYDAGHQSAKAVRAQS